MAGRKWRPASVALGSSGISNIERQLDQLNSAPDAPPNGMKALVTDTEADSDGEETRPKWEPNYLACV